MRKTLGGDRLGAGKRQKIDMHGYERSTHDMGFVWRSTMAAGTLVPFMNEIALPGDSWDIDLNLDVKTHPTVGPLFGSFKWQLDLFLIPVRLYIRELHNNKLGIGMHMDEVKLPFYELTAIETAEDPANFDVNTSQINPSSLLAYLGVRGIGWNASNTGSKTRNFNAVSVLGYYDIGKNYYSNKQEEVMAAIHTNPQALTQEITNIVRIRGVETIPQLPTTTIVPLLDGDVVEMATTGVPQPFEQVIYVDENGRTYSAIELFSSIVDMGGGNFRGIFNFSRWGNVNLVGWRYITENDLPQAQISVTTFLAENIDEQRELILGAPVGVPYDITTIGKPPYTWLDQNAAFATFARMNSQEGLLVKTYQSDLFNNWLNTEWIDGTNGIREITAIDVSGGELFIDDLLLKRKVYDMLNRIAVSGGTYQDYMEVQYDHESIWRAETPVYLGGMAQELIFQEVVSNSAQDGEPLGTLAGKGRMGGDKKGGHVNVKVDEIAYIMGIVSGTPRIDYSQGNRYDVHYTKMDDFHVPAMDQIGFQELITEQMAWWSTFHNGTTWVQRSAGKQPAWINYMTNHNRVFGNFAIPDNEMFMTLNRRYDYNAASMSDGITDLTTYIDPAKYNFIFADTSLDSQNFWVQIGVNAIARRKMSAKVMPNL